MFDLNALIPVRIVAALLAVAALMASPAVEAAQCADELSEIAYSVQMLDIDADESPQNDGPEQQECAHGHCHHVAAALKSKLLNDMPDRPSIAIGSHMAEELVGDATNLPKRPPRS
ncbi:hypothetical protein [Qipengyuania citrea]|jgi:hypothetical protein|uniref:hypothetical protein n=1 Tax=Qipengyuania citrea TaxID=225971 RepID=UPI0020A02146|nr:hypothetical protein [Qipengyuania citrea]MCP2017764.1 hypothetical protein [Qipengyuania citrea]|tara:strand:- start:274963 stop:275310 length:348 start_codon:yes stop_codon:yes gene_type:complete